MALIITSFMIRSSLSALSKGSAHFVTVPVCSALVAPQLLSLLSETQTATVISRGIQLILWKCSQCTDREYLKVI